MKPIIALTVIGACALLGLANGQAEETTSRFYSSRYNNLNVDTILSSDRLVTNYVECLLSRKPCPPEGKDLKRILPEALRTKCARCSNNQRESALKIITKLYYDYPEQYSRLRAKWDPSGEYHRRFEEYLRGLQFNVISNESPGNVGQGSAPSTARIATSTTPTTRQDSSFSTDTQRPARNPGNAQNNAAASSSTIPPTQPEIFNRFGSDDDSDSMAAVSSIVTSTARINPAPSTQRPVQTVPAQAPTTPRPTPRPAPRRTTTATLLVGRPTILIDRYYVTQPVSPFQGIINTIGFKITTTADFIAGMLRGTIQKA